MIVTLFKVIWLLVAGILLGVLSLISYLSVTNINTTDGSAQGFGAIIMPLLTIPFLLACIPFMVMSCKKMHEIFPGWTLAFIFSSILFSIGLLLSIICSYFMISKETYSMIPVIATWISLSGVIFCTIFGVIPFTRTVSAIVISLVFSLSVVVLPTLSIYTSKEVANK